MGSDVQAFAFFVFRHPQADGEVDDLERAAQQLVPALESALGPELERDPRNVVIRSGFDPRDELVPEKADDLGGIMRDATFDALVRALPTGRFSKR